MEDTDFLATHLKVVKAKGLILFTLEYCFNLKQIAVYNKHAFSVKTVAFLGKLKEVFV